jgi:hypothetical protein
MREFVWGILTQQHVSRSDFVLITLIFIKSPPHLPDHIPDAFRQTGHEINAKTRSGGAATKVAQTGSLLYRGLAIRNAFEILTFRRLAVGDTAGCQPALRKWLAVHPR